MPSSKSTHRRIVGGAIRKHRHNAGLTIEDLAEKADLHTNTVGAIERGIADATVESLVKLARALRVRVRDFVADL